MIRKNLVAMCVWLGNAPFLLAQDPAPAHKQIRIGAGLGYGSVRVNCSTCTPDTRAGITAFVNVAGTPGPNVRLGADLNVWTKHAPGLTQRIGNLSATLTWVPSPPVPFFFKLGAGVGFSRFKSEIGGPSSAMGLGGILGIGVDAAISRRVALTPVANFYFGLDGDQTNGGTVFADGVTHRVIDFGVGVTLR